MLTKISEHQPVTCDKSLDEETFNLRIKAHQEQIQAVLSEKPISIGSENKIHREIKAVLDKDISSDLTPFMVVARCLHTGQGFEPDPYLALEISKTLAQGCEGHTYRDFQYFYALLLASHENNFSHSVVEIMKKLVSEDHLPAIARYGTYLENGSLGVSQNEYLAEDYYRQAAKAGHVVGLSLLARINRKKANVFEKMYGLALTAKLILLLPIVLYRMQNQYDDRDTFY